MSAVAEIGPVSNSSACISNTEGKVLPRQREEYQIEQRDGLSVTLPLRREGETTNARQWNASCRLNWIWPRNIYIGVERIIVDLMDLVEPSQVRFEHEDRLLLTR